MRVAAWAVGLLLMLILAGCADRSADPPAEPASKFPTNWALRAVPYGEGHDHLDTSHHQDLSTPNFRILGHDPLISPALGATAAGALCGDAGRQGDRAIGIVQAYLDDVAFSVVDLTDPARPVLIGEVVMPNTYGRDVALTEDGLYVVVAVNPGTAALASAPAPLGVAERARPAMFRDACGMHVVAPEDQIPWPPGVLLFSIADPTAPEIVDYFPLQGLGAHSVTTGAVGGRQIAVAGVETVTTLTNQIYFFDVTDGRLEFQSVYQPPPIQDNGVFLTIGHNDAWVQDHPVTGEAVAYVANWDQGMIILDISDIRSPQVMSTWSDGAGVGTENSCGDCGAVHEAFPMRDTTIDGRHYTFIGQEIGGRPESTASGWIKVLDTTDPRAISAIGEWSLPVEVEWSEPALWSTHYVDYHEDTLFVSHYHAGVWAVDLAPLREGHYFLPAIGAFIPAEPNPHPPKQTAYQWSPTVMEANVLPDGELIVWDAVTGVYVVAFDADMAAPGAIWAGYPAELTSDRRGR